MRVSPVGEAVPTAGYANANVGSPDGLATQITRRFPPHVFGLRQRTKQKNETQQSHCLSVFNIYLSIMAADRLFKTISLVQICIHLCAYLAAFVKLILIEAGGYYDTGVMSFIGITLISMPLFAVALWLIQNSTKLSDKMRVRGYYFYLGVCIWSIRIIIGIC